MWIRRRVRSCLVAMIMSMRLAVSTVYLLTAIVRLTVRVGQSIIHDPRTGRDVIVYHYVKYDDPIGGPSYLGINYLDFSSGWPAMAH